MLTNDLTNNVIIGLLLFVLCCNSVTTLFYRHLRKLGEFQPKNYELDRNLVENYKSIIITGCAVAPALC